MLTQAIARAFDLDDDGVVKEPVQEGRGDDGIIKNFAPFGKAAIGGEDHGALFVAGVDELEEQIAAAGNDGQVADFVDDEQGKSAEEPDLLAQGAFTSGLCGNALCIRTQGAKLVRCAARSGAGRRINTPPPS